MPRPLAIASRVASILSGTQARKPRVFLGQRSETLSRYERAFKDRFIRARSAEVRRALIHGEMDRRTAYCGSRALRRAVMFAAGVAGVRGSRWARMMRGARRGLDSWKSCR